MAKGVRTKVVPRVCIIGGKAAPSYEIAKKFIKLLGQREYHTMETRPVVPARKLLARFFLIREEARKMMGGGLLDERNDRGLNTLPKPEGENGASQDLREIVPVATEDLTCWKRTPMMEKQVKILVLLESNHCLCVQACFWRLYQGVGWYICRKCPWNYSTES